MSKAPPSSKRWYVVVLGNPPSEPITQHVTHAINMGEPVPIPDEAVAELAERRLSETNKRPFTEIHRHFTVPCRADHNRERMNRSIHRHALRGYTSIVFFHVNNGRYVVPRMEGFSSTL